MKAMKDTLLIEIGTEDLPATNIQKISKFLLDYTLQQFDKNGIKYGKSEHFVALRRIALRIYEVPFSQPDRTIQKRGPNLKAATDAEGNPSKAALGFAQSCGTEFKNLETINTPKGEFLSFNVLEKGREIGDLLSSILTEALKRLPAKTMHWSDLDIEFIRPIHWLAALWGSKTLENVSLFNIKANNTTYGHRFHYPKPIKINHADNYLNVLRDAKVLADQTERRSVIVDATHQLAAKINGIAHIEPELLEEIVGLVEWPVPLLGNFAKEFLAVPKEALISSMQNHQKCFPIVTKTGELLPQFIMISNTQAKDPHNIIHGNERVMHARLKDAKFFFENDCKTTLASKNAGLEKMIFQKQLGSFADKVARIGKIAQHIATVINTNVTNVQTAASLCKADLLTEMVFEFPELQGIMGRYYALNDGENSAVATAIQESYLPRFAKDELPESLEGVTLALADRLDNLIGIFGIGKQPTGEKDPFALRRQTLAILRIITEKSLSLDLSDLYKFTAQCYGNAIEADTAPKVLEFSFERLKAWYLEQGVSPQVIDSVLSNKPSSPFDFSKRVLAVDHFKTLPEAEHLASANKRVRNILQKGGIVLDLQQLPTFDPKQLKESAENSLADKIQQLETETKPLIDKGEYQSALTKLASLQPPVDLFFDKVMVMTDDENLRKNRINLLSRLYALFMKIADISKLAL